MQKTDFIILLFCAIAAILHGMSGFGFPMLSTAAVAMLYPLSTAVALVLDSLFASQYLYAAGRCTQSIFSSLYGYCKKYWGLIFSALIGSYLGVSLLLILNEGYLKLAMGVLILLVRGRSISTTSFAHSCLTQKYADFWFSSRCDWWCHQCHGTISNDVFAQHPTQQNRYCGD